MKKEIVLPPHLFDRIKASAGEHGGIGRGSLFSNFTNGVPLCAHGHAWGTCSRFNAHRNGGGKRLSPLGEEPELRTYLSAEENDWMLSDLKPIGIIDNDQIPDRISFDEWCKRLDVKRGVEVSPIQAEKELAGAVS